MIHGRLTFKLPPSVGQTEPEIFELVHWMCSGLQKLLLSGVIPPQGPGEASAVNTAYGGLPSNLTLSRKKLLDYCESPFWPLSIDLGKLFMGSSSLIVGFINTYSIKY